MIPLFIRVRVSPFIVVAFVLQMADLLLMGFLSHVYHWIVFHAVHVARLQLLCFHTITRLQINQTKQWISLCLMYWATLLDWRRDGGASVKVSAANYI